MLKESRVATTLVHYSSSSFKRCSCMVFNLGMHHPVVLLLFIIVLPIDGLELHQLTGTELMHLFGTESILHGIVRKLIRFPACA